LSVTTIISYVDANAIANS